MKLNGLLIAMLMVIGSAIAVNAQEKDEDYDAACNCPHEWMVKELERQMKEIEMDDELNVRVDSFAHFKGGDSMLVEYMKNRIINPAKDSRDSARYSILARFIVEKSGKITNVVFLSHTDPIFEREAKRFMATMPRWVPAIHKKKRVRSVKLMRMYFGYPDANVVQTEDATPEMLGIDFAAQAERERLAEEEAKKAEEEEFHFTEEDKRQFMEAKDRQMKKKRSYEYYEN